jgi:hypothetical protein
MGSEPGGSDAGTVSIESIPEGGVRVVDPIERRQCDLRTDGPVDPGRADPGEFRVPLDDAVTIETDEIALPRAAAYVRDADGDLVCDPEAEERGSLGPGSYEVEVSAPIKLYLRLDGPLEFDVGPVSTTVSTPASGVVCVGARSYHERPAATITTTGDPRDVMRAVSLLGSALKTTSPERSFPTLRGHPPTIELGESFDAPAWMAPPDTGLCIQVPVTHAAAYVAAPLAYYLGAEVAPGPEPRIVADGRVHALGPDYEAEVERVLKQSFLLDCVVRTEGLYPVDLHERRAVAEAVDLEFGALYDATPARRLSAYLTVPWEAVAEHVPTWKLTCHVEPSPDAVEALPFLVDDLAIVRSPSGRSIAPSEVESEAIQAFLRGGQPLTDDGTRADSSASTTVRGSATDASDPSLVRPEIADSLEQAWLGEHAPLGANKLSLAAFRNGLDRQVTEGPIDITVVCNDQGMLEEHEDVAGVYGSRGDLPFDVTLHEGLTTDRLRMVLETEADFLHYIGHIEDGGFDCSDGLLDATALDDVGVDVFFLNACSSYEQGMALVEAGAVRGVATLADVINSGAVTVGRTVARLLNQGFPLRGALDIARNRSVVGAQYVSLGDGNVDIAHSKGLGPTLSEVSSVEGGYENAIKMYTYRHAGMGSMFAPAVPGVEEQYLVPGRIDTFEMDEESLRDFFEFADMPVLLDGEFRWSSDLSEF